MRVSSALPSALVSSLAFISISAGFSVAADDDDPSLGHALLVCPELEARRFSSFRSDSKLLESSQIRPQAENTPLLCGDIESVETKSHSDNDDVLSRQRSCMSLGRLLADNNSLQKMQEQQQQQKRKHDQRPSNRNASKVDGDVETRWTSQPFSSGERFNSTLAVDRRFTHRRAPPTGTASVRNVEKFEFSSPGSSLLVRCSKPTWSSDDIVLKEDPDEPATLIRFAF